MTRRGRNYGVGISDSDIRRVLTNKSPRDLAKFILKGVKENKTFRRKVLAWIIDDSASELPDGAAIGEVKAWIEDVLEIRGVSSRPPDLRGLNPVKAAVRNRPDLSVPAHIAIVEGIGEFLDTFGGGPESYYDALYGSFAQAARNLPFLRDSSRKMRYLERMEYLSDWVSEFGYGVDSEVQAVLEDLRQTMGQNE